MVNTNSYRKISIFSVLLAICLLGCVRNTTWQDVILKNNYLSHQFNINTSTLFFVFDIPECINCSRNEEIKLNKLSIRHALW